MTICPTSRCVTTIRFIPFLAHASGLTYLELRFARKNQRGKWLGVFAVLPCGNSCYTTAERKEPNKRSCKHENLSLFNFTRKSIIETYSVAKWFTTLYISIHYRRGLFLFPINLQAVFPFPLFFRITSTFR